ncbi:contactin-like isoform X2 [Babylonia areolata]|uniref:contactin-like isoform X1 n=1 Tax=Babylonia areolata TaxID=304850 RepID=UPI003FD588FF
MDTMKTVLSFSVLVCLSSLVRAEIFDCPDEWVTLEMKCYRFVLYPELNHDQARAHCGENGASLVGINSRAEHAFISTWLMSNDLSRREFYTSGLIRNLEAGDLIWESDGSMVSPDLQFWLSEEDRVDSGQFITYKYGVVTYGWSRAPGQTSLPCVCEISRQEAYRVTEDGRDFDYGLQVSDPNDVPRGPKFTKEPSSVLLIADIRHVVIDCVAFAKPSPSYRMFRTLTASGDTTLITPETDARYSLTNGRLTISQPTEADDAGWYACEAENPHGTVLSHRGLLSFGMLGEFSNVQREKVRVQEHRSGVIDCMAPIHKPAVAYGWMKFTPGNFLRTDLMTHLFVSYNGKLYFSEVGASDAAEYFCMVKLMAQSGSAMGTDQPPARVSLPIELEVTQSLPANWGPEISNDFIAVFPRQPLRGQRVRMECLAFGTMPIYYTWRREGWPLPVNATLAENNRVLELPDVQLDDSGEYVCRATRGSMGAGSTFQEKSYHLSVQSTPYFIYDLHDQHVDEGRRLTWRCEARGVPSPTYSWFKNGEVLANQDGDVEISGNVLTVVSPDAARHDGMYQCAASNTHGVSYSTGQLRVLGFKPSFTKSPVHSKTMGAAGGTVTILCSPEAAPTPAITWLRNGSPVGSPEEGSRIRVLANGNVVISQLVTSDEGTYTCRAENSYGTDSSEGMLQVLDRTTISQRPVNTVVIVNSTAFLTCQPSHHPALDVEIAWYFQGKPLNWRDVQYRKGTAGGLSGLYIQGAQKRHAGIYTCQAKTSFDTVSANATLAVRAPPGEPAGVTVDVKDGMGRDSVYLQWTPTDPWGAPVTHYTVQASSAFNDTWLVWKADIPESSTVNQGRERRQTRVENLKPWTSYRFRICARNIYGYGPYSLPTSVYQTSPAAPSRAPVNVTAGEGKVGDLNITWLPLPPEDQGGPGIGYNVYHRLHSRPNDKWIKTEAGDVKAYVHLVGPELFYTLYDVMVQAFNDVGPGPNSSVETIYSAEDLPRASPTDVRIERYNATALLVTWVPVEDSREVVRGKILGYQVNYWEAALSNPLIQNHYTGQATDRALVIGLLADTWYRMDVLVYNSAGAGPPSEEYSQRTWKNDIKTQPTEIAVMSHSRDSVYVTWRGVSVRTNEETLTGYVMQYWPATDNIRTALTVFTGKETRGVIRGLQKDLVYKLRVYPLSRGGDGASSPDRLFTLGGEIRYDPVTTEILAGGGRPLHRMLLLCVCVLLSLVLGRRTGEGGWWWW